VVAFLCTRPHFGADIAGALADIEDIGRIVQRFIMGRGDPSDLLAVNRTIRTWSAIIDRFKEERAMEVVERNRLHESDWTNIDTLISRMTDLQDLSTRITMALDEYSSSSDPILSEDSQVNDDKLDNTPFINGDNHLWRHGSGKWTIKPGYFPVFVLYSYIDNFKQVLADINNAPWHTSRTLSKERTAREGPAASLW
jgi:hypothetical protein